MFYLTAYEKVKPAGWGQLAIPNGKKYTMRISEYKPSECIGEEMSAAANISYWSQDKDMPEDKSARYRSWRIAKRSGGMRQIKEPIGNTKSIQRNICYSMKSNLKILPHDCCHGFVKNRRCMTAMLEHQKNQSNWFIKLDIHNFFPSVSTEHIRELFNWIPQLSELPESTVEYLLDALTDETGHLTQGCVSSPYIANLVLLDFDYKFSCWCKRHGYIYTRYADDMCISSRVKLDLHKVEAKAQALLPEGIELNRSKSKLTSINQENVFLGIHYNQDKNLTVGHETKHLMKVIAHKAELGQLPAEQHRTWKGRLSYYTSIEPGYFSNSRFDAIRNL